MTVPSFRCIGGSVMWGSVDLSDHDVKALIGLYRDEAKAAWRAGDFTTYTHAAELHGQIFTANFEAQKWARAAAYSNTEWKEAS